ncbi:MAG: FHA domain-containing protein [Acidimicrobiia bacterium]
MICGRCGHRNQPGARFCSSCGSVLVDGDEATLSHSALEDRDPTAELEAIADLPDGTGLVVVARGPNEGSTYLIDTDAVTVGRHPDSSIFLDDITVSRRHSVIERKGDEFFIRDVGSLNGTYVNHDRVEQAKVANGDEIQIGRFVLIFRVGGA